METKYFETIEEFNEYTWKNQDKRDKFIGVIALFEE